MKRLADAFLNSAIWLSWFLIFAFAGSLLALILTRPAGAQPHDMTDPGHWYPIECCNALDCAPVDQVGHLASENGGLPHLIVRSKHGTVMVPATFPRRESKDGRMHVCMRPNDDNGGRRLICLFMPGGM